MRVFMLDAGFLGRSGDGHQAEKSGAEGGGTEVHLHDDRV